MTEAEYRLGVQLHGHADDVRGICVCGDAGIATSSSDRTVKFWTWNPKKESEYVLSKNLTGHSSFVGPLAWIPTSDRFLEGGIIYGMDTFVFLWDLHKGEIVETMKGHNSQVTGLAVDTNGDIISSSMDCTVRHWRTGNTIEVWEAHKVAVQTVLKLSTGELFTGSSDSTIKLWKGKTCIQTFSGHADTVRCLAEMPGLGILSASHDSTVKLWALTGQPLLEMIGHSSLVYAVDAHSSGLIASGSEDRSLKIWKDGSCVQSIEHPGCIWDVKFLENGDIVTACSDGTTRIWTTHANRFCSDEEFAAYTDLIYQYTLSRKTVGGLKLMDLPRVEALQVPENVDEVAAILKIPVLEFEKGWRELIGERKIRKIFNVDIYKKDPEQLIEYAVDGEALFLVKLQYLKGTAKKSRQTPTGRWSQSHGPRPVGSSNLVTYYLFQFERDNVKSKDIKMWQFTFVNGDKDCVICLIRGLMTKFFNFSIATLACEALVKETVAGQEDADDCCDIMEKNSIISTLEDKIKSLERMYAEKENFLEDKIKALELENKSLDMMTDECEDMKKLAENLQTQLIEAENWQKKLQNTIIEKELLEKHNLWLYEELKVKAKDLAELRKTNMDEEAKMSARIAELEREISESSSSLRRAKERISELEQRVAYMEKLEREISESSSSLRRAKERISELEQRVAYMEKELCSTKDAAAANEQRLGAELSTVIETLVQLRRTLP